jgi:hypothetical protein
MLHPPVGPVGSGFAHEAVQCQMSAGRSLEREQIACRRVAEDVRQALLERLCLWECPHAAAVVRERERNVRVTERQRREKIRDARKLRRRCPQVLAPGWNVCEQIAYRNARSRCRRDGFGIRDGQFERARFVTDLVEHRARNEPNVRDRRDAGEAFTAKAERRDARQIGSVAQFAGGVTREGEFQLLGSDARTVIADLDRI